MALQGAIVIGYDHARKLVREPYDTLDQAVTVAVDLARGGWQVILGPPRRDGLVWILADVSDAEIGMPVGKIRYRRVG